MSYQQIIERLIVQLGVAVVVSASILYLVDYSQRSSKEQSNRINCHLANAPAPAEDDILICYPDYGCICVPRRVG